MSDRTTFRLPGHNINPLAERKCLLSLLAAYSRQWNPRNLEAPWYEPWSQIFTDLVAGHSSLSVAPQPYLRYDPTSQSHTTPSPAHLLSTEDEELDELQDGVGNTTLDSICSVSVPSHRNRSKIPDFAITRKVSCLRPDNDSQVLHLDRRVTYVGVPLLAELKASGARCHDIRTSLSNAIRPMNLARDQLFKQAFHLFKMYPHQEIVILLAVPGFWWSYFVYPHALPEKFVPPEEEEEEEELDLEHGTRLPTQNDIHSVLVQNPVNSNGSETPTRVLQEHLYGFPLSAPQDNVAFPRVPFHTVMPRSRLTLCEGRWSDYLLYGTAPSNQVLSLILDQLHSVVHVHYDGRMG